MTVLLFVFSVTTVPCLETTALQTRASIMGHALIGRLIMSVFAVRDILESTVMQSDKLKTLHVLLVVGVGLFIGEITNSNISILATPTHTLQQGMHTDAHTHMYTHRHELK